MITVVKALQMMGPANGYWFYRALAREFGLDLTPRADQALGSGIPYSEETLQKCRGSHYLMPRLPLSLDDMWYFCLTKNKCGLQLDVTEECVRKKMEPGWSLMRVNPFPFTGNLKKMGKVAAGERHVTAAEYVFFGLLSKLDVVLNVICADQQKDGQHLTVSCLCRIGAAPASACKGYGYPTVREPDTTT